MQIALWLLQGILSIKLLSVAFTHGLRHSQAEMEQGIQAMGPVARPLLIGTALLLVLGSVSLVTPALLSVPRWLTPLAAAVLAGLLLLSITFHITCREQAKVFVSIVLFAMSAFVAYGRWVLSPL